jgi:cytidylate kinase
MVITFDGPAASGKSSVSRRLAEIHGWSWVSTGAFYRGLARVARLEDVPLDDELTLATLAREPFWEVRLGHARTEVHYRNKDITDQIASEETGQDASQVSRFPLVRQALLKAQRDCASPGSILIAEGRDCGTVVFPHAQLKFYLTATATDRAERRALETGVAIGEVETAQKQRDHRDSSRKEAPLQIPTDATIIDTTGLDLTEVVAKIDKIVTSQLKTTA